MLKLEATKKTAPSTRAEAKTIPRPKGNQSRDDQAQAKLETPPRLSQKPIRCKKNEKDIASCPLYSHSPQQQTQ